MYTSAWVLERVLTALRVLRPLVRREGAFQCRAVGFRVLAASSLDHFCLSVLTCRPTPDSTGTLFIRELYSKIHCFPREYVGRSFVWRYSFASFFLSVLSCCTWNNSWPCAERKEDFLKRTVFEVIINGDIKLSCLYRQKAHRDIIHLPFCFVYLSQLVSPLVWTTTPSESHTVLSTV